MKFTIITTVYNSFNLMEKYFESLINQTYKCFDVIIIDDCSSDESFQNIKQYITENKLENYNLLKTDKNSGPGEARNLGIRYSSGEYIVFLDSDDYFSNNALEKINGYIESYQSDCLLFNYISVTNNGKKNIHKLFEFDINEIPIETAITIKNTGICAKIYKKEIINKYKLHFPSTYCAEDLAFNVLYFSYCKKIVYLNDQFYYYVTNSNSITNNFNERRMHSIEESINYIENNLKGYDSQIQIIKVKELYIEKIKFYVANKKSSKEIKKFILEHKNLINSSVDYSCFTKYQKMILFCCNLNIIIGLRFLVWIRKFK